MDQHTLVWPEGIPEEAAETVCLVCHKAWQQGLLAGFNGNVSVRVGENCVITCSGVAKGALDRDSLCLVRIADGQHLAGAPASSETPLHLEIYRQQPKALAIVHTHPPKLLALGACVPVQERLRLPVFEAEPLRERLAFVADHAPGSLAIAMDAGLAAQKHEAVWLERHGLVAWSHKASHALALSEELEHLANIQLMLRQL